MSLPVSAAGSDLKISGFGFVHQIQVQLIISKLPGTSQTENVCEASEDRVRSAVLLHHVHSLRGREPVQSISWSQGKGYLHQGYLLVPVQLGLA